MTLIKVIDLYYVKTTDSLIYIHRHTHKYQCTPRFKNISYTHTHTHTFEILNLCEKTSFIEVLSEGQKHAQEPIDNI